MPKKKHFFPKKNIFLRKNNIFFRKKTFFSEKTTFFSDKKHFFPASESDCPIHLISFRSFRSRAHRNRYHCVIVWAGKPRTGTRHSSYDIFSYVGRVKLSFLIVDSDMLSLRRGTCYLFSIVGHVILWDIFTIFFNLYMLSFLIFYNHGFLFCTVCERKPFLA